MYVRVKYHLAQIAIGCMWNVVYMMYYILHVCVHSNWNCSCVAVGNSMFLQLYIQVRTYVTAYDPCPVVWRVGLCCNTQYEIHYSSVVCTDVHQWHHMLGFHVPTLKGFLAV